MSAKIQQALRETFGLAEFRLGQLETIGTVLGRHDALAVMPTGGGKSLCYQLPTVLQKGVTLVISPLIALMRDQVASLRTKGIACGCLYSTQDFEEKRKVFRDLEANESFLLYLSPERVQKEGFGRWIKSAKLSLIAIDEAHCVSQWGPDFRPDYYKLNLLRELRPEVPILALTATATPLVLGDIARHLHLREPKRHVYGFYRPNLYYQVEFCESDYDKMAFLREALTQTPEGRVIVYAGTRKRCEELTAELSDQFAGMDYYHAGLGSEARNRIQDEYNRGETRILMATNAFGMGVDSPDVRLIVHYQMPANIDSYYQEVGRAGRDGKHSTCLLLYSKRDKGLHSHFIIKSDAPEAIIKNRWRTLDAMVQYAEGGECRHAGILTYFRDSQRLKTCGHCDVCDPDSARRIERSKLPLAVPRMKATKKTKLKKSKTADRERPLSPAEQLRYEIVKEWRYEFAQSKDVPAFLVFSNKTLEDLVRKNPGSLADLEHVYGIGPQKIEAFGKELLQKLSEC